MNTAYLWSALEAGTGAAYLIVGARALQLFLSFLKAMVAQPEAFFTNKVLYLLLVATLAMGLALYLVFRVGSSFLIRGLQRFSELRHERHTHDAKAWRLNVDGTKLYSCSRCGTPVNSPEVRL